MPTQFAARKTRSSKIVTLSPLRYHPEQHRLWNSPARFKTVPCGRRSGKTELAKRNLLLNAYRGSRFKRSNYFAAAPARQQAKRIYWDDLKAYSTDAFIKDISETELYIEYINGSRIYVLGVDKPERIEGTPWDGGVLDEFANMKVKVWKDHVRPALSDRLGWCWFIGVPEGRNHYYDLSLKAFADKTGNWDNFHWISADILPKSEIIAAKEDLDELTYLQEYEASFVNFTGLTYYNFDRVVNCRPLTYRQNEPLYFTFDFNTSPGTAGVVQEQEIGTCIVGEVYIPQNSNTQIVCSRLIEDFGDHQGPIVCFGDATGGAGGSAKVQGSDWALIKRSLNGHFGSSRISYEVPSSNPTERARVNTVNSRVRSTTDDINLYVDPEKAPYMVKDFEGVRCIEGGSGEIDKKHDLALTHLTDGLGYYIHKRFPIDHRATKVQRIRGF